MHVEAYDFVEGFTATHGPFASVVEIGSRDINGSVRSLFGDCAYVGVDIESGPGADVVADAVIWRPLAPVDCVVCCEVLEHHPDPEAIVNAAAEMLVPGGWLCLTTACDPREPHSGYDGGALLPGEYYGNIWLPEVEWWFKRWENVTMEVLLSRGDLRVTAQR